MSDRIAVMSAGKVLQVGAPRDIYDHPANRFVANFIGESNFLTGDVLSVSGARADVKLASGAVIAAGVPDGLAPNGPVTVVVRPEHAVFADPATATVRGTVKTVVYFGTDTHYHLALQTGDAFTLRQQNRRGREAAVKEGETVGIEIPGGVAQVLKD